MKPHPENRLSGAAAEMLRELRQCGAVAAPLMTASGMLYFEVTFPHRTPKLYTRKQAEILLDGFYAGSLVSRRAAQLELAV